LWEPALSNFDPDLDPPPSPTSPRQDVWNGTGKRLVVNPFLVVMDWLVAFAILRAAIARVNFKLFQVGAILLLVGFLLVQYHCLDCGKTGWVLRHRRHACRGDVARWQNRRLLPRVFPSVGTQIVMWCFLLAMAAFLWLVLSQA
jgi:hypothetical protein